MKLEPMEPAPPITHTFLPFISRVKVSLLASISALNMLSGLNVTESLMNLSRLNMLYFIICIVSYVFKRINEQVSRKHLLLSLAPTLDFLFQNIQHRDCRIISPVFQRRNCIQQVVNRRQQLQSNGRVSIPPMPLM